MDLLETIILLIIWFVLWMAVVISGNIDQISLSPELRQCLSQSGTTWQWGECVIILNK